MPASAPRLLSSLLPPRRSIAEVDRWMAAAVESDRVKTARAKGAPPQNFRPRATPGNGILPEVKRAVEACTERYFITLTSKRRFDRVGLTRELNEMLHRVNTALFGNFYARKKQVRLGVYAIHERSENDGLHVHMVVGVPEGSLTLKPNRPSASVPQLIITTWCSLDPQFRRRAGQDAQEADFTAGCYGYIEKRIRTLKDVDYVDVENCNYPKNSAAIPHRG